MKYMIYLNVWKYGTNNIQFLVFGNLTRDAGQYINLTQGNTDLYSLYQRCLDNF